MQSSCEADEPMAGKRQMANGGRGPSAMHQRTYDRITTSDNAQAHFGDRYNQIFHGPVHQVVDSALPLSRSTPQAERTLSDALQFDGMDARRTTIKVAYGNTCQWFFDSPEYIKWRDDSLLAEHHGFLWLRGKPGAGKSTLMRLAVKHADQKFPRDLRMYFFFNMKGTPLERLVEGMLRSLLHQLLDQCSGLDRGIKQRTCDGSNWPVELLEEHFRDCVLLLRGRNLTCHIDALDECEESDIRAMIEFFEDLGCRALSSHVRLRVCFASRHYPYISMSKCVQMVLDRHPGHCEDITTYVRDNLRVLDPVIRDELTPHISFKAHGMFLWVVHTVRLINEDSDRGHSQSLDVRLDVMPVVLTHLYEDAIFKRGTTETRYFVPMLLWLAFAQRPLSAKELYHAVMYTSDHKAGAAVTDQKLDPIQIERFILNTAKGLAEISPYNDKHVSFIHDTVRQYLRNSGIGRLDSSKSGNPAGLSYELLKTNCLEYILLAGRALPELLGSAPGYGHQRRLCDMFPLLDHTLSEVVAQAELAHAHGVSQKSSVEGFPLDLVLNLWNTVYRFDNKCNFYSYTATKTYIFALSGAPNLLQLELESKNAQGGSQSRFDRIKSRRDPAHSSDQGRWGHPLHAAISIHDYNCVKLLLEHGFDPNARGLYSTALESAIRNHWNDMSIIRLLLHHRADANARRRAGEEDDGRSPILRAAIDDGSLEAVKLLVEHDADISAKGEDDLTALEYAREWCVSRDPIIDYLVEREIQEAASAEFSSWTIV